MTDANTTQPGFSVLEDRTVLRIAGGDRVPFLQGLVSNDVEKADAGAALYAAFLTAQGKYLHDFFIAALGETLLLDCEAARADDLARRLTMYKLRSDVQIERADDLAVAVGFESGAPAAFGLAAEPGAATAARDGVAFVDPRLAEIGVRVIAGTSEIVGLMTDRGFKPAESADYDRVRMALGLPDGSRDMVPEKSTLLENGFDELHGVDWDKGCFLGQELTARTRYRGLTKKRLMPVEIDGDQPETGEILRLDGKDAGEIRSVGDGLGLALVRLDALRSVTSGEMSLTAGKAKIRPRPPAWMSIDTNAE